MHEKANETDLEIGNKTFEEQAKQRGFTRRADSKNPGNWIETSKYKHLKEISITSLRAYYHPDGRVLIHALAAHRRDATASINSRYYVLELKPGTEFQKLLTTYGLSMNSKKTPLSK